MAFYPEYKIAAGNNNAAGLTSIEDITPSGDRAFLYPRVWGGYRRGQQQTRGDGTLYIAGHPSVVWVFPGLSKKQFYYLSNTYCSGGLSGLVTIRTRLDDPDTYANYNAVMRLTESADSNKRVRGFIDYPVRFIKLEAL